MALEHEPLAEHAHIPESNSLTAVFASRPAARNATKTLATAGIPARDVLLITSHPSAGAEPEPESAKADQGIQAALDEIVHSFSETFSDDDKAYARFDRALEAGGAILNVAMSGREDQRTDLAVLLRDMGAFAVYYWGALATEQL